MIEQETERLRGSVSDAELIVRARQGDSGAFATLYERHVESARSLARAFSRSATDADDLVSDAFAKVLAAMQRDAGPDVAFRPYLLACVRNCAYDRTRRDRKVVLTDEVPEAIGAHTPEDPMVLDFERGTAAQAFASLPERWRMVLWHSEVEGMEPAEIAPLLGLTPNAVAALAYRARDGLRQAFLQAQLREDATGECRYANERFGAKLRDRLDAKEQQRVDDHLDGCERCRTAYAELLESNSSLRTVIAPIILGAGAAGYLAHLTTKGGVSAAGAAIRRPHLSGKAVGFAAKAKAVAIAGLAASVAIGTAMAVTRDDPQPSASRVDAHVAPAHPKSAASDPTPAIRAPDPIAALLATDPGPGTPTMHTSGPGPASGSGSGPGAGMTPSPSPSPPPGGPPAPPPVVDPANLRVSMGALGNLISGRDAVYLVGVQNTGLAPAAAPAVSVHLGAGLVGASVRAPGWDCTAATDGATCTRESLAPGASDRFLVETRVTAGTGVSVGGEVSATTGTSQSDLTDDHAAAQDPVVAGGMGTARVIDARADLTLASNTVLTCPTSNAACAAARQGSGTNLTNNGYAMTYVDIDGDSSTFNSSRAALVVPGAATSVLYAGLVWGAETSGGAGGAAAPNPAARGSVRFSVPGAGYHTVIADRVENAGSVYQAYADVTAFVAAHGAGQYGVADLQAGTGANRHGGWSLVVVYADPTRPERTILVTDGLQGVSNGHPNDIALGRVGYGLASGTPAKIGFVLYEGDLGAVGDSLSLNGAAVSDAANPANDIANSSASAGGVAVGGGDPADRNRFGLDADVIVAPTFDPNAPMTLAFTSSGDTYFVGIAVVVVDR